MGDRSYGVVNDSYAVVDDFDGSVDDLYGPGDDVHSVCRAPRAEAARKVLYFAIRRKSANC